MARKVDELGRMVLPSELRKRFGIGEGDYLAISVEGQRIVLQKVESGCIFCDDTESLVDFKDKYICSGCLASLRNA